MVSGSVTSPTISPSGRIFSAHSLIRSGEAKLIFT